MVFRRAEVLSLAVALLGTLGLAEAATAQTSRARAIYCCDVGGQPICGDILPDACYGRAYREVSPAGTLRRVVPAPLSAEEIAQRDAAERQRRSDEAARAKQERIDQALLETYHSLEQLDARREREVGALDRAIQVLRQRETELLERQSALIREAGELGDGGPKATIEENIRSLDGEIVTQRRVIDAKLRERSAVLDRFDEDRQRYLQLTSPAARPNGR